MKFNSLLLVFAWLISFHGDCSKDSQDPIDPPPPPPPPAVNQVDFWLTKGDQSVLLQKQNGILAFGTTANGFTNLDMDSAQQFQTVDGFGYTLTSGSAQLINSLSANTKSALLRELFSNDANAIGINYLRLSIGASDLSASVYSYDDMPAGQTDPTLANFSLNPDRAGGTGLIPLLKEILQITPSIKIMATPWSPPVWMKDNGSSIGGSLKPEYYSVYAQYFVKYIQGMQAEGIIIDAITPQNEPLHPGNNPSLLMTAAQQKEFIRDHLGPTFQTAGITTKIVTYDHNCDRPDYPLEILADPAARAFVNGSAFHLYAGDISALSTVHSAYPDKDVYFTEQYTASTGGFEGDLKWHLKNVIIGSMRNWSKTALEWNLANDQSFGPHTPGGCTTCKGAITVSSSVTRNVGYYIIAHASKFVPTGSKRVMSTSGMNGLFSVGFITPDGKKVLVVLNEGNATTAFNIRFKGKWTATALPASSVGTYVWN